VMVQKPGLQGSSKVGLAFGGTNMLVLVIS
jgi:hypothetical protein